MTTSAVSICSNALQLLGAGAISSFDDNEANARRCAELWPTTRDWLLRKHPWNCAIKRVVLAPDAAAPAFGFARAFSLPADWLRTLEIGDDTNGRAPYKLEGRKILCDETSLKLRYVARLDDPQLWDSHLVHVGTIAMKAALAYPVTASTTLADSAREELVAALREARSVDGLEEDGDTLGDFPLIAARF